MKNTKIANRSTIDRNNTRKVRYVTEDKKHSTLTINPILYELIRIKTGDPEGIISKIASETRRTMIMNAEKLEAKGELFDISPSGETVPTTAQNWVRGKISHNVTNTIILEIADPKLLAAIEWYNNK